MMMGFNVFIWVMIPQPAMHVNRKITNSSFAEYFITKNYYRSNCSDYKYLMFGDVPANTNGE